MRPMRLIWKSFPRLRSRGKAPDRSITFAFAVEDRAAQARVRQSLLDTGYQVTPVIDRDYFWAIYFRPPGGVLFEIATHDPGFDRDEDRAHLGEALKLPGQYEPFRAQIEDLLPPLSA